MGCAGSEEQGSEPVELIAVESEEIDGSYAEEGEDEDKAGSIDPKKALWCNGGGFPAFWYALGKGLSLRGTGTVERVEGYSAGAMAAALIALEPPITVEQVLEAALATKEEVRIQLGKLDKVVSSFMDRLLPADAHRLLSGRLGIVICEPRYSALPGQGFKGKIVTQWASREDLISCITASAYIPGITGFARRDPVYCCVDGGMSRNLKDLAAGKLAIAPPDISLKEMFQPLEKERAMELYSLGAAEAQLLSTTT